MKDTEIGTEADAEAAVPDTPDAVPCVPRRNAGRTGTGGTAVKKTKPRSGKTTAGKAKRKSASARAKEKERAILEQVWSRKTALEGLKRIFETALEGARIEVRDGDGALVEVKFNPSAANAATKAVETANRMLGYTTPEDEESTADAALEVTLGEAEEFAL